MSTHRAPNPPPSSAPLHPHPPAPGPPSQSQQPPQSQPPSVTTPTTPISPAQRTAEARTAFTASLHSAAANLDSDLVSRAKNIHANAKALSKQEKDVEREVRGLRRANDEMEGVLGAWKGEWGREIKRMGLGEEGGDGGFDLGGIERELGVLEDWVKIVEEEDDEEEADGGAGKSGLGDGKGKGKAKDDGLEGGRGSSGVR